ncbi:norbelladine synthase-like [Diospyros lotus]|uniref:norbelladine synthase-like n=1 Tax=Diospyros lotus TaxID=55363 RepID=UPI0022541A21|nr:norbelladine synthase-like [Diospyros lotus]
MFATVSHEMEVKVPASKAWRLYSSLKLANVVLQKLSHLINKIDILEGDGGVGTVLRLQFPPGTPGFTYYKEKFTKIDDEKRAKEAEVIEGGYLDLGFTLYRVRFEVIEKSEDCCITKATIEYDLKEEAAANASIVSIQPLVLIMETAADYLTVNDED